ncbi:lethal(3)malignant brain tumor-like protein 3 isoform X1 [Euwallacea fornicatus]|uniref:lethal(3)malignant brain tumor-like protein 3 isoform X1 n=1 Tax=Euwallacea fornicatus TaxID=995702 RepID=UPI00338F7A9B
MSANVSPEYSSSMAPRESPNLQLNQTTQIIIENSLDDITISKCDKSSSMSLKSQVLPLVYIKNNNNKLPIAINPTKRPRSGNFVISSAPPTLITSRSTTVTTISRSSAPNIFIAGRGRSLVLPKQPITIMPQGSKVGTYVTMLKPVSKQTDIQISVQPESSDQHLEPVREFKSTYVPQNQNAIKLHSDSATTQPQKFILTGPLPKLPKGKLISPMPRLQTSRPPITATTDCVQSAKFTVLPFPVPPLPQKNQVSTAGQKMINFQISDGKIFSHMATPVTIMGDNKIAPLEPFTTLVPQNFCEKSQLRISDNLSSLVSEKNDISSKSYELSIADDESLSNQSEPKLVVSSADSNSSTENNANVNRQPPKFSHAVSILKKNVSSVFADTKKVDSTNNNGIQNIVGDNDITIIKPSTGAQEKVTVTIPDEALKKPEREKSRRKSQFHFRKDFDDIEVSFPDEDCKASLSLENAISEEIPEIKEEDLNFEEKSDILPDNINIKSEVNFEDSKEENSETPLIDPKTILNIEPSSEIDAAKLLQWDDNIGNLPGSNLKFFMNEFGILEFLTEEDHQKLLDKKYKKAKMKENLEREVQCTECGCYGIRADFVDGNCCSMDCQSAHKTKSAKYKEHLETNVGIVSATTRAPIKRRFPIKSKSDNDIKHEPRHELRNTDRGSADEETSNDASQDKFSYPWECKKKGFSWSKYLMHIGAKAAPVKLFKDPFPYTRNLFKPGMKMEGVDPQHPSYFCVLTVMDVIGYRLRLHFDGYSENYDFWTYADSSDLFPMGWCEKYNHTLRTPPSYTEETFNWLQYLRVTKSTAAPKHLFVNRSGQAICPNGFRIGMKLEAVDKKNYSLICVATVRDMMYNRILVHFDGWDDIYDYWAEPTSPYIHPVGWCDRYGHDLTPPSDYATPETFTWEAYLKETKSVAAPVRAFKQRPICGFKRGMRLECVDKRVPHLIRVATVDDVKDHQIRIHFDGWPDRYSYWVDDDSPDIHPIGWCQKTGHPLEPPLTPDDVFHFLDCPTVGCRGEGHIYGMRFSRHSTQETCPYAEPNIDCDKTLPDRLLSPNRSPEAKEPISRQPRAKPKMGRPPKWRKDLTRHEGEKNQEPPEKKPRKRLIKHLQKEDHEAKSEHSTQAVEENARSFIEKSKILPAEHESWKRHSTFLKEFVSCNTPGSPLNWSKHEVHEFVTSIPGCDMNGSNFSDHEIDGEAFLQLSQNDLLHIMSFKMGPAVKLYNTIVLLRDRYCDKKRKQ